MLNALANHAFVGGSSHFGLAFLRASGLGEPSRNRGFMPTIALVDDDRNILTSVSIALEAEGYRIMTYTDGASALDGFKTSPPDLAILDIKMPRMDGMETLRRLRQKSDMPVIFLTSKDAEIVELFGLKMGADDFIRKPFSQRLLGAARRSTALTRSTRRRCENGLRMKSSAPIFRPNNSSISSSFEVRKITGRSDFCRNRRSVSMPSMRGILMSRMARSGGDDLNPSSAEEPSV